MLVCVYCKVILIDGDMCLFLVYYFGGVDYECGFSNFFVGEENIVLLIFEMDDFGFIVMLVGLILLNVVELLMSNCLLVLIECLLQYYDYVVIDFLLVMGLVDVLLIVSWVEGVIYVVELYGIWLSLVKIVFVCFVSVNVCIFGGVFIKFEVCKVYYGYGYQYGYNYGCEKVDV